MSDKKEIKEIDVASLDSELAAARTLEEGKGDKFIMMASVVAFLMTSFHIYTGFFGLFDYSVQRGVHLGFALTLILLTQPLYKHVFKDKFAGSKAFRAACRTFDMILVVLTWVSVWMAQDEVHHLTERLSKTTWMATFAGACLVIIVLEGARRSESAPGHRAPRLFPRAYLQVPRYRPGRSVRHDHECFRHGHLHVRYVRRVP